MGWVKQIPAWAWLLFIVAVTLKIAATIVFDWFPSTFAIIAYGVSVAILLGLAFFRWKYWGPSEVNLPRQQPESERRSGSDSPHPPTAINPKDTATRRSFLPPLPSGVMPRKRSPPPP